MYTAVLQSSRASLHFMTDLPGKTLYNTTTGTRVQTSTSEDENTTTHQTPTRKPIEVWRHTSHAPHNKKGSYATYIRTSARITQQLTGPVHKARRPSLRHTYRPDTTPYQLHHTDQSMASHMSRSTPKRAGRLLYVCVDHAAVDGAIAGGSSTSFLRRRRLEIEFNNPAARPCDGPWFSPCPALNASEAALTQYLRVRARWAKKEKKTRWRGEATTACDTSTTK